jgi:PEP-CTERM motif-containing protein
METMMSRFVSVSLVALLATCAAVASAVAGGPNISVPEPSSLALLASGVGVVYLARKLRRGK